MLISDTLRDNLVLLLVTALITGFATPFVLKMIEFRKTEEQKMREALLIRQNKILDAQAKFLDDISSFLWKWRYLCIKLTYYGGQGLHQQYEQARQDYNKQVWATISQIRNEISKSRWLVSEEMYVELIHLYEEIVKLDVDLNKADWLEDLDKAMYLNNFNDIIYSKLTARIDDIINHIASTIRLDAKEIRQTRTPPN